MCGTPTIPAAARFFSIPRRSGMYVSQWKKQSKGNHMKQNYTPDLVLNKWQNIQENLCNELPFYSFKKWTKGFQKKTQESPVDCSSHISFAWYYHEKPRLHRKFESHGSQRQKKTEMGDFYELIYLEPMKHPRIQNGRLDDDSFFFCHGKMVGNHQTSIHSQMVGQMDSQVSLLHVQDWNPKVPW